MSVDHDAIDAVVKSTYGKGVMPNPFASQCKEWERQRMHIDQICRIDAKIFSLFEPRFITMPETAEVISALVTMTGAKSVLEIGTCTGFTTYHILRALIGKAGARIVTVDSRPAHDPEFFSEFSFILTHVNGCTPDCLKDISGPFDLVFVDSDHSLEHTQKEVDALMPITQTGTIFLFHDVPEWPRPDVQVTPVREWLLSDSRLRGLCLPSGEQADCLAMWGEGYPKQCNPGLGIFMRL